MDFKLHHIGYAVRSIETTTRYFSEVLGYYVYMPPFAFIEQNVRISFLKHPNNGSLIELVEGASSKNPVEKYIRFFNGGAYHLCYEVDDLEASCRLLKERNFSMIQRNFMENAAFKAIYMLTPDNQLIEFIQQK